MLQTGELLHYAPNPHLSGCTAHCFIVLAGSSQQAWWPKCKLQYETGRKRGWEGGMGAGIPHHKTWQPASPSFSIVQRSLFQPIFTGFVMCPAYPVAFSGTKKLLSAIRHNRLHGPARCLFFFVLTSVILGSTQGHAFLTV